MVWGVVCGGVWVVCGVWYSVWCGMVWCVVVWCVMWHGVWYAVVWCVCGVV